MKTNWFFILVLTAISLGGAELVAQKKTFTKQDTLRGSITPERAWWDLNYYDLSIEVNPTKKYLTGTNTIRYKVLEEKQTLQIDLQPPLKILNATQEGKELRVDSQGNAHFITLKKKQLQGAYNAVKITYAGKPKEAIRAPWDGGFSWKKDKNGKHFIATSCQGLGASVWWPNKDHMYDEVDSMAIRITGPKELLSVANGKLLKVDKNKKTSTYHWLVRNPINNYGVNLNIGDYVHFNELYEGEKGTLDLDYYVLKEDIEKAKTHFTEVPKMLKAFEHWFGPYPFYEDSFKLVQVPYLGMEHQSSVTYGNQFKKGYLGSDLSGTGWGLKFDFIIIHESAHEWFANNITNKDIADMWIHEGFACYSESLFLDYYYGKKAASEYVIGLRKRIANDIPIIGNYNVNDQGSSDMYYKGSNLLHTLRQIVNKDTQWRKILRGINNNFYHSTVTTQDIEAYLCEHTNRDLTTFFEQYLRTTKIPELEYYIENQTLRFKFNHVVPGFTMPLRIFIAGKPNWIHPTDSWNSIPIKNRNTSITTDPNFYITYLKKES